MERPWTNSFWGCCDPIDTCLMGCFCPCFLFGRTQSRNKGEADPSCCNMDCCAWYVLMHCWAGPCLQAIKRSDMRAKFHLEGNCFTDWAGACCCTCCSLIQEEKESLLLANNNNNNNNEKMGYNAPQGMNYGPPQNGHYAGPQNV